ncbi:MAG: hypothetical protein B7X11_06640 [Acidobacteria bacterium 37-65-4]|nr:MAG: hypothetical protein B7X11_06640 [Acidobacteria bacterium 37-65-4]
MLGAVCHDLGKPLTTKFTDGRIRSIGHEEAGVAPAMAVLDRLNIHTLDGYDVRRAVAGLTAQHLKPGMFKKSPTPVSDGAFRRLAMKVDLELLARLAKADCLGRPGSFDCSAMDWFLERARALGVAHAPPTPLVLGRHVLALGVPPGPRVGQLLKQLYERQLITGPCSALACSPCSLVPSPLPSSVAWRGSAACEGCCSSLCTYWPSCRDCRSDGGCSDAGTPRDGSRAG